MLITGGVFWVAFPWADVICKEDPFFYAKQKEIGWFYKNPCVKEEEKKEKKKEKEEETKKEVVRVPWEKIDKMKPEEIKELLNSIASQAVASPTYENVREYYRLLVWVSKKSEKFMKSAQLVMMTDPVVAGYVSDVWINVPRKDIGVEERRKEIAEYMGRYRNRAGLIVVVERGCPYCEKQKEILSWFQADYGWEVLYVDKDQRPDFVQRVGTYAVPDIFLAVRNSDGSPYIVRLGTGLTDYGTLLERMVFTLKSYEGGMLP